MHVMDGDCEKTAGCLAAESAPELGLNDKHGSESIASECQESASEESKTPTEKTPLNGERIDHKEEAKDSVETAKEVEPPAEDPAPPPVEDTSSTSPDKEEASHESDIEAEPPEEEAKDATNKTGDIEETQEKAEDLSKVSKKENKEPEKEAEALKEEIKEEKEDAAGASEEEDRQSVSSSHVSQSEMERRKRSMEREGEAEVSSGSESEGGRKRLKQEGGNMTPELSQESQGIVEDDRERVIREFVEGCSQNSEEIARTVEKLQKELSALTELARAKELEWNSILRLRKLKEEMLERILRKRRQALVIDSNSMDWTTEALNQRNSKNGSNQLMMVPIVSSSPGNGSIGGRGISTVPPVRIPEIGRQPRPILPKPYPHILDPGNVVREGRNGPILDVKSIIADYRSRHPENVPRRGRRVRGEVPVVSRMSSSPALISMANMALGSGASVRTSQDPTYAMAQDHSRSSSTDTSRTSQAEGGVSFKDVLVQFAKLSQSPIPGKPPPPYPEVTLHPVSSPQSPPTTPHSSLLHGILTKSAGASPGPAHRPATFSPTLARLLTAPERPTPSHQLNPQVPPQFRPPTSRVSITDILTSSKKSRNEITITPVAGNPGAKSKDEVVLLDDDDETGSGDRLVIDEGGDGGVSSDDVPQCQGCRQKSAQFVCAGCGNQWYCSRECQVTAWEEHSDVCSG